MRRPTIGWGDGAAARMAVANLRFMTMSNVTRYDSGEWRFNTGRHSLARTVQVHLTDDIDGGHADETIEFGLDGTTYEIDLSSANASALRTAFKAYVDAARKAGRGIRTPASRRPAVPLAKSDRSQNRAIRDWAKRKGLKLSERGRIPGHIVEQFEAEAGR